MATKSLCSIPDCDKPACTKRGWCAVHYYRWRKHGDPLKTLIAAKGEPGRFFREVVLSYEGTECLVWPFAKSQKGYGKMWDGHHTSYVHRLACEALHGPPPSKRHDAAHSCGKGHLGCVTNGHLRWATRAENMQEMVEHGTSPKGERCGRSTITEGQARQIMAMKGTMSQPAIAREVGTTISIVRHILSNGRWGWLFE